MVIRAIIFDLGGVLLRTADFSPREKLAARYNVSRTQLEELIFGGFSGGGVQKGEISLEEHWKNVQNRLGCSPEELRTLIEVFFAEDELDEDLVDYVRTLRQSYKTALLSNATADLRKQIAERWHFEDAFDELIISGEVKAVKPEPKMFKIALERLGVEAGEAIFVDDMRGNVEAAEKLGLRGVQFISPQQVRDEIEQILKID